LKLGSDLTAFGTLKRSARIGDPTGKTGYELAKILVNRRRFLSASRLLDHLRAHESRLHGLQILRAETELNLSRPEECLATVDNFLGSHPGSKKAKRIRTIALRQQANKSSCFIGSNSRHVAIGGVSYIGSTLFGVLLGSIDGIENVGESHWLVERLDAEGPRPIDFENDDPSSWHHCQRCGKQCEIFSPNFRRSLANDPTHWYQKIGDRLSTPVLISSDKNLFHYWSIDPLFRFDLVVLYKSPEGQVRSFYKALDSKIRSGKITPNTHMTATQCLGNYVQNYGGLLKTIRPRGRRVVMNWEKFVSSPEAHFDRLLKALDFPGSSDIFQNVRIGHVIGGNGLFNFESIAATNRINIRPSNAPLLTPVQRAEVAAHGEARKMFRMLENEYQRDFSGL